jgi:hypothetical protein
MFSKNIGTIYLYTVSFITILMFIGGFVSTANNVARLVFPERNYNYEYKSDYKEDTDVDTKFNIDSQMQMDRTQTIRDIINSIAVIVVSLPLYAYHSKKIEKEFNDAEKVVEKKETNSEVV